MNSGLFIQILTIFSNGSADLLFSFLCGLLCAAFWGDYPPEANFRFPKCIISVAVILSVLLIVQLYLLAAAMMGTDQFRDIIPLLTTVISSTHAGRILSFQFCIAMCIAASMRLRQQKFSITIFLILLLSIFRSAFGHAASNGNFSLREVSQWVHLLSTGIWSGGVFVASMATFAIPVLPLNAAKRLSRQSLIAVVFILISGCANTWLGSGSAIAIMFRSTWGHVLFAKLTFILFALFAGFMNRTLIRQTTASGSQSTRLTYLLRYESLLMLAIIFLSGWLATTPPPGE